MDGTLDFGRYARRDSPEGFLVSGPAWPRRADVVEKVGHTLRSHTWIDCCDAFGAVVFASRCARQSHSNTPVVCPGTFTLTWTPPTTGDPPSTYIIEAGFAPGTTSVSIATGSAEPSCNTVRGAPVGIYYVRVRAQNAAGVSEPSNEIALGVGPCPCFPPTRPASASGSVNGSLVTLRWDENGRRLVHHRSRIDAGRHGSRMVRHEQHRDDVLRNGSSGHVLHPDQRPQRVWRESAVTGDRHHGRCTSRSLPEPGAPSGRWVLRATPPAIVSCSGERCVPTLNPDGNFSCRCDPLTSQEPIDELLSGPVCQQENRLSLQAQLGATQVTLSGTVESLGSAGVLDDRVAFSAVVSTVLGLGAGMRVHRGHFHFIANSVVVRPGVIEGDFLFTNALDGSCTLVECTLMRVRCEGRGRLQIIITPGG